MTICKECKYYSGQCFSKQAENYDFTGKYAYENEYCHIKNKGNCRDFKKNDNEPIFKKLKYNHCCMCSNGIIVNGYDYSYCYVPMVNPVNGRIQEECFERKNLNRNGKCKYYQQGNNKYKEWGCSF